MLLSDHLISTTRYAEVVLTLGPYENRRSYYVRLLQFHQNITKHSSGKIMGYVYLNTLDEILGRKFLRK